MTEKDGEKDDMSRVSCSCMGVEYSPIRNEDGSFTERWACKDCGNQFVKIQFLEKLRTRVVGIEKQAKADAEAYQSMIEHWKIRVAELEKENESQKSVCGCLAIEKENKELIEKVKSLGKEMFKQNQLAYQREESLKTRLQLMGEKLKEWQNGKL